MNQTAHISLQSSNFQRASRQNQPRALIFLAQPANPTSDYYPQNLPKHPPQSVPRPNNRLSSAGEGVFTVTPKESQELFYRKMKFSSRRPFFPQIALFSGNSGPSP
jgi:hypothetical protein